MDHLKRLFGLDGKVAVVTGARVGLGRGLAVALAKAGADVVGVGPRAMPETAGTITAMGRRFVHVEADLAVRGAGAKAVADALSAVGRIDVLVNNAGIIRRNALSDYTAEDWDAVMQVNLDSLFEMSQAAAAHMMAAKIRGRIVNIASMLSYQGGIRVVAYTAAKHAVAGVTKAMGNELAPHGITVNAIAPGYMDTDNTAALKADPVRSEQILQRIPAGRWGLPDDLATAVLFLAAPASDYVTGTLVPVDGGWLNR